MQSSFAALKIFCAPLLFPLLPTTLGNFIVVVLQSLSPVQLFTNTWTVASQVSLPSTVSWNLLKFMFIELVILSNHLIICCPLLLLSVFPSIRVFSYELVLGIRWPKYWSFSINHSNEYSGLISFRIDWFDLLAVQGNLKSLVQHTVQKHRISGAQPSLWSNSHIHT